MSRRERLRAEAERRKKRKRAAILGGIAGALFVAALVFLLRPWQSGGVGGVSLLTSPDQVQRISLRDAKGMIDEGEALLYDVRSAAAYESSHAAGAISFPEDEVNSLIPTLPPDKKLIFYCT